MALIPDAEITFKVAGQQKTLRYRAVPFSAWAELKQHLGLTPGTLMNALADLDVEAYAALVWLERRQRERKLTWHQYRITLDDQVPDLDMDSFDVTVDGQRQDDDEDPTGGSSS